MLRQLIRAAVDRFVDDFDSSALSDCGWDSDWAEVESCQSTGKRTTVYNLRVTDWHTYFVAAENNAIWVHNADYQQLIFEGHPNHVDALPFGFKESAFHRWTTRFYEEFGAAGFNDPRFFMQGSAASGFKHSSGIALDARRGILPSDYDIAVLSPQIMQRAEGFGIDVLRGPLTAQQIFAFGLSDAQRILTQSSKGGIPVNFKMYRTVQDIYDYSKTIPFPR
jgi:hypothetical protein